MTKTKEYTNDLEEKINHSENQTIKYFKGNLEIILRINKSVRASNWRGF